MTPYSISTYTSSDVVQPFKNYLFVKGNKIAMIAATSVALLLSACSATGVTASTHTTNVQLNRANYRILATNVSGQASSEALLGVSVGFGMAASQFAIIPVSNDRALYQKAMNDLWAKFEATHGSPNDKKLALVNFRYDSESLNTFLYTQLRVTVVADVIEFTE